jgi:tetratricopeptide (TPR) repeat protein
MNEMLGNQYFMARRYAEAANELEKSYKIDPRNKGIRKKLIVCYTQMGKVNLAWELFIDLISEDLEFILNTDPVNDDCPCFELVEKQIYIEKFKLESRDILIIKGIIWLYCDINKSLSVFEELNTLYQKDPKVNKVIKMLKSYKKTVLSIK